MISNNESIYLGVLECKNHYANNMLIARMENPKLDLLMGEYSDYSSILSLVKSFSQTFKLPF